MPTRKTVTEVVEDASQEAPVAVIEDEEVLEQEDALDGLLAEFMGADNVVVNVYRQGDGKNLGFLFKTHPQEMTGGDIMERCRDKYGTGDYRMHVREGRRLVSNRPFSVEAPKEPDPVTVQQNSTADIIALIQAQNAQMATLFQSTMLAMAEAIKGSHSSQPAVDPVAMQASVIQGLAAMKEIAGGNDKGPSPMEMLIKGIELAKDIAPKTGETNVADLGLKFMEALPALQAAGSRGSTNPPVGIQPHKPVGTLKAPTSAAQTPPPQSAAPNAAEPQPENIPDEKAMLLMQVKANLAFLCKQAQQNKDPALYAELILDQMGEEKTLEFVGSDNALERLAAVEPKVKLYPGWFADLKAAILELTADENDNPETETSVPDGDSRSFEAAPTDDHGVVLARINASGLRREGRERAPVTIPGVTDAEPEADSDTAPGNEGSERSTSQPASDT